jgi:AcrR family transcriptional regulator
MQDDTKNLGRPRDASIDARVTEAAAALLVEEGFASTTVQAIARRSGVHASAIYRRWPSRIELIEEVVFPGFDRVAVAATGDLRGDLRRFLRVYLKTLGAPAARAAIPGLLASYQSDQRPRSPYEWLRISARPQFQDILLAAPPGEVDPAIDPDEVFDLVLGAVLTRILVPAVTGRRRTVDGTVDLVMRLLRPTTGRPHRPAGEANATGRPKR